MVSGTQTRPRGRREAILVVALDLFARRGYQSTGIDDIGAALDITGPAIYRHFGSKQELLAAAFAYSFELRRQQILAAIEAGASPRERLELLIRDTVRNSLERQSLVTLYLAELGHLAPDDSRAVRLKAKEFTDVWIATLMDVFPSAPRSEATMAVYCVQYLIGTLAYTDGGLDRARLEGLLTDMSMAALYAVQPQEVTRGRPE